MPPQYRLAPTAPSSKNRPPSITLCMFLLQASRRSLTAPCSAFTSASSLASSSGTRAFTSVKPPSVLSRRCRRHLPLARFDERVSAATRNILSISRDGAFLDAEDPEGTMIAASMKDSSDEELVHPSEMSETERYLFDLNGYIVVRNVLTPEEVASAHSAIDAHIGEAVPRSDPTLRNAVEGSPMYGTGPPRLDLGGICEWDRAESSVFKSILAHPRLVPLFHGLLGKGYRLDHLPFVLMNDSGGEGFQLHGGTVDCTSGEYNGHLAYNCHNGQIRSNLLGCNVMLVDHDPGDGGFCVVPGSHKSNFRMPPGMVDGLANAEYIVQPATKAGDVVLFSEGTVHGAMGWTPPDKQRRCALYRFAPATMSYGRSYFRRDNESGGDGTNGEGATAWPAKFYDGLNDAQRAVLEPPYANRLDRPNIMANGGVEITRRSERKRRHDRDVFKTKYF